MKLYPIQCGNFKLDGGAMFGVVPKSLWERTNPADSKNLIELGNSFSFGRRWQKTHLS